MPSLLAIWSARRSAVLIRRTTFGTELTGYSDWSGYICPGRVGVGGDLPAGQVDRLQPGLHLLHRLVAGERAQRVHERLGLQQVPQPGGAHLGQSMADAEGAGEALHILRRVVAADPGEALGIVGGRTAMPPGRAGDGVGIMVKLLARKRDA